MSYIYWYRDSDIEDTKFELKCKETCIYRTLLINCV